MTENLGIEEFRFTVGGRKMTGIKGEGREMNELAEIK